jgi:hypothetical protein
MTESSVNEVLDTVVVTGITVQMMSLRGSTGATDSKTRLKLKTRKNMNQDQAIEKARQLVARQLGVGSGRQWLVGKAPNCYTNPDYQTEIHVLEGSPQRGFVFHMKSRGGGVAISMDYYGRVLRRFQYPDIGE